MGRPEAEPGAVVIVGRRDPLKMFLLLLCVLTGGRQFFDPPVGDLMPWWGLATWFLVLLVFGLAGLVGVAWRDPITGLLIERVAVAVLGFVALAYAVGLAVHQGDREVWNVSIVGLFAVACSAKVWHITVDLGRTKK